MWRTLLAASLLAGCSTVDRVGQTVASIADGRSSAPDTALDAILHAAPIACPNGRTLENANHEAFGPQHGVVATDIALTPLANDPTRAVRMRRIVVEPGGVIAWHTHEQVQGSALVVSGEMTEIRNSCVDPIRYHAGDVAMEDAQTAHGWRNDGDVPAVIIVAHVVPRN
ncbi:MAG: cupin domain-containing protein [Hyphomonadaceae bacterium]|nr:cupin domain-containing protein [Hyphomonadaceae bacterium]